jgi:hypothetical protein
VAARPRGIPLALAFASMPKPLHLAAVTILAAAAGCTTDLDLDLGASEHELTCPVPTIDPARSLAVTDATALERFSFRRVMDAIIASANATSSSLSAYQAWMSTFAACTDPAVDPNGYGIVCPRVELELGLINPFLAIGPRFVPVALTNRFDLAPSNGSDCGEYRIVYALVDSLLDRAFLIFEGRLPNPTPSQGLAGCAPVADLWASLSADPSAASRAAKLEQLYFTGLVSGGVAFAPVITAQSYGLAADGSATAPGQIRTNMFVKAVEWQLREFKLTKPCAAAASCALSFKHVTVKTNPANELFAGTHANAPAFQSAFPSQVSALSSNDPSTIAMATSDNFNELESVSGGPLSQRTDVVYRGFASAQLRSQIQGAITNPALTVDNILDRATTQTCAGCHQLSNNVGLGGGVTWPSSLGFVHIDENKNLSTALTQKFLPHRATVLSNFLQAQCSGAAPALAAGRTVSGAALGSPN